MTHRAIGWAVAIVLGTLATHDAAAAVPKNWNEAAREAAKQKRLVLIVYREGKTGQSTDDTATRTSTNPSSYGSGSSGTSLPITTTLSDVEVRPLVRRYCVLAKFRMGDDDSGWKNFESHGSPVVFALPDGTFLHGLSTDATPEQFTNAMKLAVEKAREIAKEGGGKGDGAAGQPAAQPDPSKDAVAMLKEADALAKKGDYGEAVRLVRAVMDAAEADSPDAKRADRVAKSLTKDAEKMVKQAESLLAGKKAMPAFRQLDEVAHLFAGLPVADEAAKRLDELLAQPIMEDFAAEYRQERVAYDLYDKAMGLLSVSFWKEAGEKFQEIADKYPQSPVAARATAKAEYCRKQNVGPATDAAD